MVVALKFMLQLESLILLPVHLMMNIKRQVALRPRIKDGRIVIEAYSGWKPERGGTCMNGKVMVSPGKGSVGSHSS